MELQKPTLNKERLTRCSLKNVSETFHRNKYTHTASIPQLKRAKTKKQVSPSLLEMIEKNFSSCRKMRTNIISNLSFYDLSRNDNKKYK